MGSAMSASLDKALAFFGGAEMPANVWSKKYRLRDRHNSFLEHSPLETFCRMADAVGAPPDHTMRDNLIERRFIPGGRILFALGNPFFQASGMNCLTGNTLVRVEGRWTRLDELAAHGGRPHVARIDGEEFPITAAWSNGDRKIVQVVTKEGYQVKATPDHRFRLESGAWKEAGSLEPGDLLDLGFDLPLGPSEFDCDSDYQFGYVVGLFMGDGTFTGQGFKVANIRLFGQKSHVPLDPLATSMFGGEVRHASDHTFYNSTEFARAMEDRCDIRHGHKVITDSMMGETPAFQAGFLRGMYDTDGHVYFSVKNRQCKGRSVQLVQADDELLRRVQIMLLGFGIKSKLYKMSEAGPRNFEGKGVYNCRATWKLTISRSSMLRYGQQIGFSHPDKASKLQSAVAYGRFKPEVWVARVKAVEPSGTEEVFDISVDEKHAFIGNGLIAHNCFVFGLKGDSLEDIGDLRKVMSRTYARGGGVGIDLSRLRPHGAPVNNTAIVSSGAASFADGFSHLTGEIGQNGRRGALMISMSVDHPDIQRFIRAKTDFSHDLAESLRERLPRKLYKRLVEEVIEPRRSCGNANMSVRLTDRFMDAARNKKPHIARYVMDNGDVIEEVFEAQHLLREIVEGAWAHGCPGCLFWDTAVRNDNRSYLDPRWALVGVNPCQPAWASVLTPEGIRTIGDIEVGSTIWSGKRWTKVTKKWGTGIKKVYAYRTRTGTFYGTEHHRVVQNGEKVEVQDAETVDLAIGPEMGGRSAEDVPRMPRVIMAGLLIGDGMVHKASNNLVTLCVGEDDQDYFKSEVSHLLIEPHPSIKNCAWVVDKGDICAEEIPRTYERKIPERFRRAEPGVMVNFLRGLYSANGSIVRNRVTLKASSFDVIEATQEMLSALGIRSYYTVNKPHDVEFENGTYLCRESYDLNISTDRYLFRRHIGFIQVDKMRRLDDACWIGKGNTKGTYEIVDVEYLGEEEVWDLTVEDEEHTYWTGGLLASNCGEEFLSDGGSCCLGAVNLARFTANPYTSRAKFDWAAFKQATRDGVRFLDSVIQKEIDENRSPDPRAKETNQNLRHIGLGVMGLGDLLLQHQIPYASDESFPFVEKVFQTFRDTAYHESIMLAKEFGPYPAWDWDKVQKSPFIDRLPGELKHLLSKHGMRNSNVLSVAPTGTIAIMGETTGGIEPEFAFQLTRACQLGSGKRTKFTILTPAARRIAKALGVSVPQGEIEGPIDMSWLPKWAVASHQIDPKRRARFQGLIQKYIDVAISSTVNLPEEATVEDVLDVYWTAYDAGCKGITVYREGSREGILQTLEEQEQVEFPIEPPTMTKGRRLTFKGEHGLQRILIRVEDYKPGVPVEVSLAHGKGGTEIDSYARALGILISIALQHGISPLKLARSMEGISAGWATRIRFDGADEKPHLVTSVPDAVAAMLKKLFGGGIYEAAIKGKPINGASNKIGWDLTAEERNIARKCPACQKQSYIPQEGCWTCINPVCDHISNCG